MRRIREEEVKTEPLDRSYTTYYLLVVLFDVEYYVTLKCGLEVTQGH